MKSPRESNQEERDLDRVSSFPDWCRRVGVSAATGRRLIATKQSPKITRLSERRIGIRERDHLAWLNSRADGPEAA